MVESPELFFAAYDPAIRSIDGRYWVWSSPTISPELLDEAGTLVSRNDLCESPNSLDLQDLWGGCVGLSPQWCVFYRYYNGGRDLVGRPERAVILFAFVDRETARRFDCAQLLDEGPFSEWASLQPVSGCPSAPGIEGSVTIPLRRLMQLPENTPRSNPVSCSPIKYKNVVDAWDALRSIPVNRRVLLKLRRRQGVWQESEFVWLESSADAVGSHFRGVSKRPKNRIIDQPPGHNKVWSIDVPQPRLGLTRLFNGQFAIVCLLSVVLVVGWRWPGLFDHRTNLPHSDSREIPPEKNTPVDRENRHSGGKRPRRTVNTTFEQTERRASDDPVSEDVQTQQNSRSDRTPQTDSHRDDDAHHSHKPE